MAALTLAVLLKVPPSGVTEFQAYEARVLPLIGEYGGTLQRRLRTGDGTAECHIIVFPNQDAFERFKADPRRAAATPLLIASGATAEAFEMADVEGADRSAS